MTQVWHGLSEVPADAGATVVTLGNFDGVHRGHQHILRAIVEHANTHSLRAVALTFDPHPRTVHMPDDSTELITGLDDRIAYMAQTGLDAIVVQRYDMEFARQSPEDFVHNAFVDNLRAAHVVVGADTRFGRDNVGDAETLRSLGAQAGFTVDVVDHVDESGVPHERPWSSSWVREALDKGHVATAAKILGRPHRVRGTVVSGEALGRTLGFPTANIDVTAGKIPGPGVYAGLLSIDGFDRALPTAVSLGINYTVGAHAQTLEAHVVGMDTGDIYGREVALDFLEYRRPMLDFGSLDALTAALAEDADWVAEVCAAHE